MIVEMRVFRFVLLSALSLVVSGCCSSKQNALDLLHAMQKASDSASASQTELTNMVVRLSGLIKHNVDLQLEAKRFELREYARTMAATWSKNSTDSALDQLDNALRGPIERLQIAVQTAKAAKDRGRQVEAAAQLGATMMAHSRESYNLARKVQLAYQAKLELILPTIDQRIEAAKLAVRSDVAAELKESVERFQGMVVRHQEQMHAGFHQLSRYINDCDSAVYQILYGALGERLAGELSRKFQDEIGGITAKVLNSSEKEVARVRASVLEKFASVNI